MAASDFEIRGAEDFLELSKALKNAERKGMRRELHREMQKAVKPLLPGATKRLAAGVPTAVKSRALRTKQVVKVSTGRDPGITVGVQFGKRGAGLSASNARLINRLGVIRHPLFGNRERWFNTRCSGSERWFDEYYSSRSRDVLPGVERAVEDVIQQIIREARS